MVLASKFLDNDTALLRGINDIETGVFRSMSIVAAKFARLDDSADVVGIPLVAQNSNLPLVVQILTAFIDHAVELYTAARGRTGGTNLTSSDSSGGRKYISNLLSSLSRLNRTIQASSMAKDALQDLMSRHSDVLMDIWLEIRQV